VRVTNDDLAHLVNQICGKRDPSAPEYFYELTRRLVYGYIVRWYGPNRSSDVDDTFQGFFEKLIEDNWRRLCAWGGKSAVSTYLIGILKNQLIDQSRKVRPVGTDDGLNDIPDESSTGIIEVMHLEKVRSSLRNAISTLSERDQEILNRTLADESAEDIAAYIGTSKATYYKAYFDAQKRLKKMMEQEFPEFFELETSDV
jgi:RNA polymerase sigma factor (sigma-70 family)